MKTRHVCFPACCAVASHGDAARREAIAVKTRSIHLWRAAPKSPTVWNLNLFCGSEMTIHFSHWKIGPGNLIRSEEHTSELQSLRHLVCRLLLEKKKKII